MSVVLPTHSCFDDAVEIIARILKAHPDVLHTNEFMIVHAIVAPYGEDMAHAWIQATKQDTVLFIGIVGGERKTLFADRAEFERDIKVKETTKYTPIQAYREEKKSGRFGPWVDRYWKLCRDYKGAS